MAFRISSRRDESWAVVRIEGRLDAASVPDLLAASRSVGSPLRLDLSGLMSADAEGAEAIRCLAEARAKLTDISPYIRQLVLENSG